jgi:hypothetical protein
VRDTGTTLQLVLIGLAVAVGAPFAVVMLVLLARLAGRHRGARLEHADAVAGARGRLLVLGDGLLELDAAEAAPGAPADGRRAYRVLLDRYERAERLLDGEPAPRAVRKATRLLGEAEAALATARTARGAPLAV